MGLPCRLRTHLPTSVVCQLSSRGPPVRHSLQMSTKLVTTRATTATRDGCVRHGVGHKQGRTQGGLGLTPTLKLLCYKNVITYAKAFVYVFAHFLLVWCQLNAKTTEWFCMKISRNTVNGQKRNNYILVGIWVIACIQEPSHHFLQTSRRLRIFMLVLRDSSLYS